LRCSRRSGKIHTEKHKKSSTPGQTTKAGDTEARAKWGRTVDSRKYSEKKRPLGRRQGLEKGGGLGNVMYVNSPNSFGGNKGRRKVKHTGHRQQT